MKDLLIILIFILLITLEMTIMSITLPNYQFFGNPSADSARFVRTDDTAMHRKDITVSRKQSVYNAATQVASVPEYRIAIRKDAIDQDGKPTGQRLTFDLVLRSPLQPSGSDFEEARLELAAILDDPDFSASVMSQLFPCVPCEE